MSCTTTPTLAPGNRLAFLVELTVFDEAKGCNRPLTEADGPTVSAFLASAPTDDATAEATALDPTLVVTPTYVSKGKKWLVEFSGTALDFDLLDPEFGGVTPPTPYVIIEVEGEQRKFIECAYAKAEAATVR